MQAILLNQFGDVEQLNYVQLPTPVPQDDEVLIRTAAISINPVDLKTRAGKGISGRLKDQMPIVLGWDLSGTVVLKGNTVNNFQVGDDVFGMINFPGHGKVYAEYVVAKAAQLALKPASVSQEEAAASTLAALTAWQALVHSAKVQPGQRVLIHAAAGGVGHFAVQVAKQLGAYVIGTSSAANKAFVLSLGADEHIDYKAQPFETTTTNIDLVLDTVGGDYSERSLTVIKPGGRLISIPSGLSPEFVERAKAMNIQASFMLVSSNGEDMQQLAKLLEKGVLKPHVSQIYPFEKMAEAHTALESGRTVGKIVVRLP